MEGRFGDGDRFIGGAVIDTEVLVEATTRPSTGGWVKAAMIQDAPSP